jgi:Ca2+:H+ antiporter
MSGARTLQQSNEDTMVEAQSIRHPSSTEPSSHKPFTLMNQLKATIFNSWINLLLIAAPVGIATHFVNASSVAVFIINFIAIIPLAALLSHATEEIALRVGETFGGLLNATFGFVYILISI